MKRYFALIGAATMVLALLPATGGTAGAERPEDPGAIPGSYIVVLAEGAEHPRTVAAEHRQAHNAAVTHVYGTALRGYAARMSDQAVARVANDPRVAYVDVDRVVTTAHHQCGHTARGQDGPCDDEGPDAPGSLAGTVTDSAGTAIVGATVAVDATDLATETDGAGSYTMAEVPEGKHTVTATAEGFEAQEQRVEVVADQITTLDFALEATAAAGQPVPWGVARVGAPVDGSTGAGVHVYVIDTGIDRGHRDLRVSDEGFAAESCRGRCAADWDDDHGHGTHVAGTIGALDNDWDVVGVAPDVTLHAVKVLAKNGSGTRSGVIAGIDWVAAHNSGQARVANMSLGGSGAKTGTCSSSSPTDGEDPFDGTDAYHAAICNATHDGVVFAVAAGNSGADAAGAVPAAYDDTVVTVSATTVDSDWPSWSNWGDRASDALPTDSAPVGIAAPGVEIRSTRAGGGTTTMSGTSMAAPHVAGAVALLLGASPQAATVTTFSDAREQLVTAADSTGGWENTSSNPHPEGFVQVP